MLYVCMKHALPGSMPTWGLSPVRGPVNMLRTHWITYKEVNKGNKKLLTDTSTGPRNRPTVISQPGVLSDWSQRKDGRSCSVMPSSPSLIRCVNLTKRMGVRIGVTICVCTNLLQSASNSLSIVCGQSRRAVCWLLQPRSSLRSFLPGRSGIYSMMALLIRLTSIRLAAQDVVSI